MNTLEFETTDKLYESARSVLYRTVETAGQPRFILKILKGEHEGERPSPQSLARFRREIEISRELRSAHVITVDRLESVDGTLVAVLEDFGGDSLEACLRRERPSLREALGVSICICSGLADIHNSGIVHKNICASNVLWNQATGEAKLTDFGIASRLELVAGSPVAPQVLEGSLPYMSPEQTGRMNRPVDYRTDFYSLGVTLYELFTGRRPFEGDDPLEIIHGHLAKQPVAPASHEPALAGAVSDIILKLLQKNSEDRYQSAQGIRDDLIECTRQLDAHGAIGPFPLARKDVRGRFRLSPKLYGRDGEVASLLGAFERAVAGDLVFTLVKGHSGVGKSVLVQELYRPLALARGRYISGKYDQYQRSVPYSAIGRAFNTLCDQLLCETDDTLERWRQRILGAVGKNGQALIEVIPRLEDIVGPQPALPERQAQSAQNLFNQVCQDFIQAICRPEEPLVLFLDDLQWADIASLSLLRIILKNSGVRGLHLVGAYRDNEVDSSHPLLLLVDEVDKSGLTVAALHLENLTLGSVTTFTADTLSLDESEAGGLARIVYSKTQGNAFFTTEFLKALHAEGLLRFNPARLEWEWDVAGIEARGFTDNVVALMASRIRLLPDSAQQLLRLAACIGSPFDTATLAIISGGHGVPRVLEDLAPAIQQGVIVAIGAAHHRRGTPDGDADQDRFRFQHDRVQQAAYSLILEGERPRVHLDIARQLLDDSLASGHVDDRLFEIVGQYTNGAALLTDAAEKLRVAQLSLQAGLKARKATAHHAALDHFRTARDFLPEGVSNSEDPLAFEIHLGLAKSCSIAGQFAEAEALYPILLPRARTLMDMVRVLTVQMDDYHLQGQYDRAIDVQKTALSLLGESVPSLEGQLAAAVDQELTLSSRYLGGRLVADLLNAPEITSPEIGATLKTLLSLWMSAYLVSREDLVQWTSVRLANLSLQHGNSEAAAFAYVQYGYLCINRRQAFEEGYQYGQLALTLADRHENLEMRGKVYFLFGIFVCHWTKHVALATEAMRKGYLFSVEAGDWTYAVYAAANIVSNLIIAGVPCDEVETEARKYHQFLKDKAEVGLNSFFLPGAYCALLNLTGRTASPDSFDGEFLNEERFHETLGHLPIVEAWFYAVKIRCLYLHRSFDAGAQVIAKAEVVAQGVPSQIKVPEAYFYSCLMLAAAHARIRDAETKARYWTLFHKYEAQMKLWADHSPDNYLHKYCLIVAERTRVEGGSLEEVLGWYDRAIESGQDSHFPNVVAVARELKGRYWLERNRSGYAAFDLKEAHLNYQMWGASTKVAMLEQEFGGLLRGETVQVDQTPATLDLLSAHKASRAISGKLELQDLMETMMNVVMESAGADLGLLLREREGQWRIEAIGSLAQGVRVGSSLSSDSLQEVTSSAPFSVVHYVARTRVAVTVDNPTLDPRFGHDPYLTAVQPRSIFCVPLANRGRTLGILYLENKLVRDVFTSARRDLMDVLAGQMAISLENASLYADLKATVASQVVTMAELREQREALVRAKDAAEEATRELETFSYSVAHDLRAPLRAIDGYTRIVFDECGAHLDGEGRRLLGVVRSETQRMGQLMDDLLHFSRLTRHGMNARLIDMGALAQSAFDEVIAADPDRRVRFELKPLAPAHGEPAMLRQVWVNLLANAVKFTGPRDDAAIEVRCDTGPSELTYHIKDNGVGFDMAYADKLFGVFQRLHSDEEFSGTGVGLALVQRVIARHGGHVWAEGHINQGATFHFSLPARKESHS